MKRLIITSLCVLFASSIAFADWYPGGDYKMHFPQLPDPDGWDVYAQDPKVLADDWRCSETGPVSDVHLWGSWKNDDRGIIDSIHVSIHKDIPAGVDPDMPWSHPGTLEWERDFTATEFTVIDPWGDGQEGWYNPNPPEEVIPLDHTTFHQINIVNIVDPFTQQVGEIYWLDISVKTHSDSGTTVEWGWKTTLDNWNDDAVWGDYDDAAGGVTFWTELYDPLDPAISLDMAFVITPEPATIALLGLGGLLLRRKRKM